MCREKSAPRWVGRSRCQQEVVAAVAAVAAPDRELRALRGVDTVPRAGTQEWTTLPSKKVRCLQGTRYPHRPTTTAVPPQGRVGLASGLLPAPPMRLTAHQGLMVVHPSGPPFLTVDLPLTGVFYFRLDFEVDFSIS